MSEAHLEITGAAGRGFSFPLEETVVSVGRDPSCQLVLDDVLLSKVHARFEYSHGKWCVRDDGSRNGTFVQGKRVPAGEGVGLSNGDVVTLGLSSILFVAGAVGAEAPPIKRIRRTTSEYLGVNDLRARIAEAMFPEPVTRVLVALADDVLPELEPPRLFRALLHLCITALQAERAALFLPDATGEPALVAEQPSATKLSLPPGLYSAIVARRGVVLLSDVGLGAGLALPLYWPEGVIGCLLVDRGAREFDTSAASTSAVLGALLGPIVARTLKERDAARNRAVAANPETSGLPLKDVMAELERSYVMRTLQQHNGHRTKTAKALGLSRQALGEKLRKYGMRDDVDD